MEPKRPQPHASSAMNAALLASAAVHISIFLVVLAVGLRAQIADAMYLFREPRLLLPSILAMNVVMPIGVALIVALFGLHPAVKVALIALAVSPVPPFLPGKELKLVSPQHEANVYGLLVATSTLAIIIVPLTVAFLANVFARDVGISPLAVARIVSLTVLLPLAVGMALRRWFPATERLGPPIGMIGTVLLVLVLALLIARLWPSMMELVGDGTLLAIGAVTLIGLAVGHMLGGPSEDGRTVLALATASRHPAVALAIASQAAEELAPAAIVLALLVGAVAATPYTAWRKRMRVRRAAAA